MDVSDPLENEPVPAVRILLRFGRTEPARRWNGAMRKSFAVLLVACFLVAAASCGTGSPASPTAATEQPTLKTTTAHFQILADRADAAALAAIGEALEANHARITADLRVSAMPVVSVWVWQDSTSFYADMQARTGQVYQGSGGWVRGPSAVSVLAGSNVARSAVHEFAHTVSIAVNPRIANNPRWLWETVALYENGELVDPKTIDYLVAGRYPTLAELDAPFSANRQVYQVGYLLGQFIVKTWTMDGLIRLIQSNGDIPGTFDISVAEFEARWHAFLHAEYGLPAA